MRNSKGFTLIEVLISAIILFLFITMASQSFSQSVLSSIKAERAAKAAGLVPILIENIRAQIVAVKGPTTATGVGKMLDMDYQWQATLTHRKAPIDGFDPLLLEFKSYQEHFNLWLVEITVTTGTYQHTWQYEEISWHK